MRFLCLVLLAACASAPASPARRVIVAPDPAGSLLSRQACEERCARHIRGGERVSCETLALEGDFEERLGYRTGLVCVMHAPGGD